MIKWVVNKLYKNNPECFCGYRMKPFESWTDRYQWICIWKNCGWEAPLHGTVTEGVYTPDPDYNGGDVFTYRAYDGTDYSDPAEVLVTVLPVNDAPVLSEIGDQVIDEDEILDYTLTAEDIEGDALFYDAFSSSEDIEVKVTGNILTVTPDRKSVV